jgi:hypothetical protein
MRFAAIAAMFIVLSGLWSVPSWAASVAPASPGAGANPPPTVEQLKTMLAQQQYQDVIRGVARCLALKGPAAQGYDHYELLMLRGEAYLRTRALPPAAEAFAAAQKETADPARRSAARADEILVRKSKPQGYLAKPSAASRPAAIPIIEEGDRKAAFAALLNDELAAAAPKVKAAKAATALPPIIDVARTLGDLRAVELAAGGGDEQVKTIGLDLGKQAHALIDDALRQMNRRVEECWRQGSRRRYQRNRDGTIGDQLYGMMGLTSVQTNDLKDAIATLEQVAPVARDLADASGASSLQADAAEAHRLLDRAKEVLDYDYANEGRYSNPPTGRSGAGGGDGQTPSTPSTPQPRTGR